MKWEMLLKVVGCSCMIIGSSGFGWHLSSRYSERLRLLEQLKQMIFLLKAQVLYANASLEEAFESIGKRSTGELAFLWLQVAEGIKHQQGEPFFTIWKTQINQLKKDSALLPSDKQQLEEFGKNLGYLDLEMQERNILLYLEQLELTIKDLRQHKQEKKRLYTSLGILGGLFLAIILC